ncbi:MAG: 2-iminoacetate synthase ThiH [Cyclobacteriaceae bacterium]|nr:2-iminoacetate synthase ThiH [Cyclobacteriaceae bacterium]
MSFKEIFIRHDWDAVGASIEGKRAFDVEKALAADCVSLEDFKALISPAAAPYLEEMAQRSHNLTKKRFGKTMQMYAPMYLSNECHNICTYCGYSFNNKIKRKTLTDAEILEEVAAIKRQGFDHILLVSGEANHTVHVDYFLNSIDLIKTQFANISIEVQPLDQEEYEKLKKAGVYAVLVYQETYNQSTYKENHPKGKKSNFFYRLETPDRVGKAAMNKIGLGTLLGLDDWRTDSFFCALHLNYLEKKYWQTKYSISFPRIRPAEGIILPENAISDKELVQLICAYRIFNEDVELSISTRETQNFRDNIIKLGATSMSAGSKTNPGGYSVEPESLEQFEISDNRSAKQVEEVISKTGYDVLWKDWDKAFS